MSNKAKKLKEKFDKIDTNYNDNLDKYDFIENEGENIVTLNKNNLIKKNINKINTIQKDLKKYEGNIISYNKYKNENFEIEDISNDEEDENEEIESDNKKYEEEEETETENEENKNNNEEYEEKEKSNKKEEKNKEEKEDKKLNINNVKEKLNKDDLDLNFKKVTNNDIKKGENLKNQKNLYEFLLGFRISLQNILINVNTLPSYLTFSKFENKVNDKIKNDINEIKNESKLLLVSLLQIHKKLFLKENLINLNEDFNPINDLSSIIDYLKNNYINKDINNSILEFHKKIFIIVQKILNNWYRKTLINSFKINNNKVLKVLNDDFCKNILNNINNNYESVQKNNQKLNNEKLLGRKRIKEEEFNYDKEIFNDIEFYNYLLKEFLNNNSNEFENSNNGENRYDLTMKYLMNKKLKKKKNVDTKASKNRKIRYEKHEKIINFMTPQINDREITGREIILNSLFGMNNRNKKIEVINDVDII